MLVSLWWWNGISGHSVNLAAVPDGPNPAHDEGSGESLANCNQPGATVPAAALVAVGLEHGSKAGDNAVENQDQTRPRDGVDMFVTTHF